VLKNTKKCCFSAILKRGSKGPLFRVCCKNLQRVEGFGVGVEEITE
jgi:hypothetical protein